MSLDFTIYWDDEYVPDYVVGSIEIKSQFQPFVYYSSEKQIKIGDYLEPHGGQKTLGKTELKNVQALVESAITFPYTQIILGYYYCPTCSRLVNILEEKWSQFQCLSCSMDQASEMKEKYEKKDN